MPGSAHMGPTWPGETQHQEQLQKVIASSFVSITTRPDAIIYTHHKPARYGKLLNIVHRSSARSKHPNIEYLTTAINTFNYMSYTTC